MWVLFLAISPSLSSHLHSMSPNILSFLLTDLLSLFTEYSKQPRVYPYLPSLSKLIPRYPIPTTLPHSILPIMSTIQNLKNFIRHGKQARIATPHAEPTTNVSTVHAEHQRQPQGQYGIASGKLDAIEQRSSSQRNTSSATITPKKHQQQQQDTATRKARAHEQEIEQIVAEERKSRSTMPKYPGLERWELVEKMGDGAFSNVYRARDITGKTAEVAIKVVRKFEMSSKQVRYPSTQPPQFSFFLLLSFPSTVHWILRPLNSTSFIYIYKKE